MFRVKVEISVPKSGYLITKYKQMQFKRRNILIIPHKISYNEMVRKFSKLASKTWEKSKLPYV